MRQGQDIVGIAWAYNHADWNVVWDHAQNKAARDAHKSPMVLLPGTRLFIPAPEQAPSSYAMGQRHEVVIDPPKVRLHVRVKMFDGAAFADRAFALLYRVGGQEVVIEGKRTDGDGWVDEQIPLGVTDAMLWVGGLAPMRLALNALDPVRDELTGEPHVGGVQARLNHLGYSAGPVDNQLGPMTRAAVALFQLAVMGRDQADGELDSETLDALLEEHTV